MKTILPVVLCLFFFTQSGNALEVRFYPQNPLYVNQANAQHRTYDVVAHMVLIKNDSNERVVIEKVDYQYFEGDRLLEEKQFIAQDLIGSTNELLEMNQQGMQVMTELLLPPDVLGQGS